MKFLLSLVFFLFTTIVHADTLRLVSSQFAYLFFGSATQRIYNPFAYNPGPFSNNPHDGFTIGISSIGGQDAIGGNPPTFLDPKQRTLMAIIAFSGTQILYQDTANTNNFYIYTP